MATSNPMDMVTNFLWPRSSNDSPQTEASQHNPQSQREDRNSTLRYRDGDSTVDHDRAVANERKIKRRGGRPEREAQPSTLRQERAGMEERIRGLEKELEYSKSQNRASEGEIHRLTMELKERDRRHHHITELLASRTLELEGAQAFLTKADLLAGAEVINLVEALNSEILQISCGVADSFEFKECAEPKEGFGEMEESLAHILGKGMVQMLRSSHDPMLVVQTALQTCLAGYCQTVVMPGYFNSSYYGRFLGEMYARIIQGEDQAVSGRWRALTKAQFRLMAPGECLIIPLAVDNMIKILALAGGGRRSQIEELFATKFSDRMATIGKAALRLNKAVGEEVTSSDLIAWYISPGVKFDPTTMDDTYAEGGLQGKEVPIRSRVLGTCGLGLYRSVKETKNGKPSWNETIILKPKVVLDSLLEEMARA